ncbi:hypothetical protein [Desulforamulus profundi]|nr:hypothetical protein [Desulforamulus profundi]
MECFLVQGKPVRFGVLGCIHVILLNTFLFSLDFVGMVSPGQHLPDNILSEKHPRKQTFYWVFFYPSEQFILTKRLIEAGELRWSRGQIPSQLLLSEMWGEWIPARIIDEFAWDEEEPGVMPETVCPKCEGDMAYTGETEDR